MNTDTHLLNKMFKGVLITNAISIAAGIICVMIDGIITGQFLGADAVAAAGLLHPVVMIINIVGGLLGGVGIMCTRYLGKAQLDRVNQVYSIVVITGFVVTVAFMVLIYAFAPGIGQMLGAKTGSQEIVRMISDYLRGLVVGMLFMRFTIMLSGLMMLDNDKNCSMISMGVVFVTDVAFDLANVLIFHGGMHGMALATSFSYVCGFLVILNHYRRKDRILHFTTKGLKLRDLGDVFLRGMPNAINMGCSALRIFAFNTLILSISDKTAVAGLSIANNAFSFIFSLVLGMFITASILSSLYYSEEDRRGLEHVATLSVRITIVLFIGVGLLIAIFPKPVAMLFVRPDAVEAVDQGARFIRFWAIQFLFMAVSFPISGTYQGTGRLRQNYFIDIMREGVLPIVCVTALGKAFGLRGAEVGFALAGLLTLVMLYLVPTVCNRKFPLRAKDFLILSDDFGAKPEELYEASMHDMDEVIKVSEDVRQFCLDRGTGAGRAMMMALFVEEMAGNTIAYGYREGQHGTVDLRFVLHDGTGTIRLRDDGRPFDPVMWLEKNSTEDPASGLGIRVVTGLAKQVNYMTSMEMNNLTITL